MKAERIFKGRAGVTRNLRKYHLYMLKPEDKDAVVFQGMRFVKFSGRKKEEKPSKARIILEFLEKNKDKAFFSKEIAEALRDKGIKPPDVMSNVRRFEKRDWFMFVAIGQAMEKLLLKKVI